ncbi:MAG TPA: SPOR domain-containing protein [Gemmatimonadales bacterium]|nr:SPOR domain-containing protein [Gemmatimonadales bacterium]
MLLTAYPTNRLTAQSDPRLKAAVDLAQAGQVDSARSIVRRLLATMSPRDSAYPQALFTQGMLAPDAATVTSNLQRVVVEFGWSPWAANALMRLAQLAYTQGDPASAIQSVQRLRRDYPDSPVKPRADFWGAKADFDLRNETEGCALIQEALAGAGTDVEFKNQVSFYVARCPGAAAPTPAPVSPATPAPTTGGTPPADTTGKTTYAVQVLAVKSAADVDALLTRLKVMGYEGHVVPRDSTGLIKVRVGHYATRPEAIRAQTQLKARLGGQPFVVSEP